MVKIDYKKVLEIRPCEQCGKEMKLVFGQRQKKFCSGNCQTRHTYEKRIRRS